MSSADLALKPDLAPTSARRWTVRRIVLLTISLALIVGLPGAAAAAWSLRPDRHAIALPPIPTPSPKPTIPTTVGEMSDARRDVVRTGVFAAAKRLSETLLAGDESGYLQVAGSPGALAMLRRQFTNLTRMHATRYDVATGPPAAIGTTGQWKADLAIDVCFVVPNCAAMIRVSEPATWQDTADGPKLMSLSPSANGNGWFDRTQPWETTDLYASVAGRVVVAAPASLRGRLPAALAAAQQASARADAYAVGQKPEAYVSYLAGPNEWKKWFGGRQAKWAAGYTTPTSNRSAAVVVNSKVVSSSFLPRMMRHEFTHAASVYGTHYWENRWWLIEGYAETAEHGLTWDATSVTRRYVDSGWNGKLPGFGPANNASNMTVQGQYGVAFLAMYRLEQRFGRAEVIEFFNQAVRNGLDLAAAAQNVFQTSWVALQADLIRFIKRY